MREADMECKVVLLLLLYKTYHAALQAVLVVSTHRRKLAAETLIGCQFTLCYCAFSAQRKRAKVRIHGESSPQKSL